MNCVCCSNSYVEALTPNVSSVLRCAISFCLCPPSFLFCTGLPEPSTSPATAQLTHCLIWLSSVFLFWIPPASAFSSGPLCDARLNLHGTASICQPFPRSSGTEAVFSVPLVPQGQDFTGRSCPGWPAPLTVGDFYFPCPFMLMGWTYSLGWNGLAFWIRTSKQTLLNRSKYFMGVACESP